MKPSSISPIDGSQIGYSSVTKDAHSQDTQERNTFLDQANGGRRLFYSTNPDLLDWEFYGSLQHSPTWRSLLGFAISINGSQSARSTRAYMGMNNQYGGGASSSWPPIFEHPKQQVDSSSGVPPL